MVRKNGYLKLHPINFGISWGIVAGICVFLTVLISLLELMPEYSKWATEILEIVYGSFGYRQGFLGLILGPVYAFVEVFIISFLFAIIYNKLTIGK